MFFKTFSSWIIIIIIITNIIIIIIIINIKAAQND